MPAPTFVLTHGKDHEPAIEGLHELNITDDSLQVQIYLTDDELAALIELLQEVPE